MPRHSLDENIAQKRARQYLNGAALVARVKNDRAFATPRQAEVIDALIEHGSVQKAADSLEMRTKQFRRHLSEAHKRAAKAGYSPEHRFHHPLPEGFTIKRKSIVDRDEDGNFSGWTIAEPEKELRLKMVMEAIQSVAEPFRAKSNPQKPPASIDKDLMTIYPMGDPHIGMYAWHEETGQDFNVEIAEKNLVEAVDTLVELAPNSHTGTIINLGDFFHSDSLDNRTRRSGHALDVDTRWPKVLRVGVRTMRRCIDQAKKKHQSVHVINEIGNHDDHTAIALSICLASFYENDPRVTIDLSPSCYHWIRFGKCLIGVTHGDKPAAKPDQLPGIMANDRAKDWGETKHRYWYTGHVHHDQLKEYPGCIVETFRTLAPADAWHHNSGYRSGRDMKCDILHREWGRINRHIVGIERVVSA